MKLITEQDARTAQLEGGLEIMPSQAFPGAKHAHRDFMVGKQGSQRMKHANHVPKAHGRTKLDLLSKRNANLVKQDVTLMSSKEHQIVICAQKADTIQALARLTVQIARKDLHRIIQTKSVATYVCQEIIKTKLSRICVKHARLESTWPLLNQKPSAKIVPADSTR